MAEYDAAKAAREEATAAEVCVAPRPPPSFGDVNRPPPSPK